MYSLVKIFFILLLPSAAISQGIPRDFGAKTCRADSLVMTKVHMFESSDRIRCINSGLLRSAHVEHEPHWFEWVICNIGWWTPSAVECKRPPTDLDAIEAELWKCVPRGASVESIKMNCHSETHDPCGTSIASTCVVVYDPSAEFVTLVLVIVLILFVICVVCMGAFLRATNCLFILDPGTSPSLFERKFGVKRVYK